MCNGLTGTQATKAKSTSQTPEDAFNTICNIGALLGSAVAQTLCFPPEFFFFFWPKIFPAATRFLAAPSDLVTRH